MRTWRRKTAADRNLCGSCARDLPVGTPIQVITPDPSRGLTGVSWVRCVFCAEGTPPADLPAIATRTVPTRPMVHIPSGPNVLPFDFKRVTAADLKACLPAREPGEDDA